MYTDPNTEDSHTHHGYQSVDTVIFYNGRASKLDLIPTLFKAIILASIAIYASFYIHWPIVLTRPYLLIEGIVEYGLYFQPILLLAIFILSLLSILILIRGVALWYSKVYRITNDRVEYEQGIFSKVILNVELWRVRDIFYRRNIIQAFFGLGLIDIIATDETIPQLEIGPIRNARKIYDQLKKARLKSGRKAGAQAMGMSHS